MSQSFSDRPASLSRPSAASLDGILGSPFAVLDDGFVRVVDYMGDEDAVVQAARVSYGAGTKKVQDDITLIRYLLRHAHTTPFEMCEIKLHVRVPLDTWRQWIRHRTASVNEYSTRYSVAIDSTQKTSESDWRQQSVENRQGSAGALARDVGRKLSEEEKKLHEMSRKIYEGRLSSGVAREQARKDLPLSTYTEAYWKIDLHNLLGFLHLRMHAHAQLEIREYATVIGEQIVAKWVPNIWDAFLAYRRDAVTLTKSELQIVAALTGGNQAGALEIATHHGLVKRAPDGSLKRSRERDELEEKLSKLGLVSRWPWNTKTSS